MPRMVLVGILLFAALGVAQEEEEPIPVPIKDTEETESLGGRSFIDDVFESTRNHWGFSVSAYQAYTTDVSGVSERNFGSGITSFMPQVFFNAGRRKSKFHLDLGAGYRMYNRESSLNSWDYSANATYSYDFSRRTTFRIIDQFTSSYNDSYSFTSLLSPIRYDSGFSNEVLFNRQRITRNDVRAQLDRQLTRNAQVGVFGGYKLYQYPELTLRNADAFEVGAHFNYRLNKWLYLTNSYSHYINDVDDRFEDNRIHRVQAGGLDFRLTRSWRMWATGGVEITDYQERNRIGENVDAGIGYTSLRSSFSVTYQHGFTSGIGIATLLRSDIISAGLGYRANRWLSTNLQTYYYRSSELEGRGLLETVSGGGGLQFALRRDLVANVNAYYQHQQTREFSVSGLGLNRLTAYVGLQYVWPSLR